MSELKLQVLVAALNKDCHTLPEKLNLRTDAVIANQCSSCGNEEFEYPGGKVLCLSRPDRGVGLNRNEALLHADGDILSFADDDMVFTDNYGEIIKKAFEELPDADGIVFNIVTKGTDMHRRQNDSVRRLHFYNALNYGAARLSVRASSIKRENITFHTCFGGGTDYSSGEDTIFIADMLRHKLKLYSYPACIAEVDQTESTWFKGYNKKLLHDQGALFAAVGRIWAKPLCLQDLARHSYCYKDAGLGFLQAYRVMKDGIRDFRGLKKYSGSEDE